MLGDRVAVQLHADPIGARLDIQGVPVVLPEEIALGFLEGVDAAGGILVGVAVVDLDFVADFGRRLFVINGQHDGVFRARGVADGDAAVAAGAHPVFHVQIELPEIVASGVEPRLQVQPGAICRRFAVQEGRVVQNRTQVALAR